MGPVNERGGASIAALGLAALVTTAAMKIAVHGRARERRENEALSEARARARILDRALTGKQTLPFGGNEHRAEFLEPVPGGFMNVGVTWKRIGDQWHADSWTEEQRWPDGS